MTSGLTRALLEALEVASGRSFSEAPQFRSIGGGCINEAVGLRLGSEDYFVKLNEASRLPMFEAELAGLEEMAQADAVRVPKPLACGQAENRAFLMLEYLPLAGSPDGEQLGQQLAQLHRKQVEEFGWSRHNTIGSTPQHNDWTADWIEFLREHRLAYQLRLAKCRGAQFANADQLLECLPDFFVGYKPAPSLLHGDLWGGNASGLADGTPVLYDPAVYYGDRETDLAFTELFGGFGRTFYAAYRESWPLDEGYARRRELYNLYHVLNHYNLFGGGYGRQAEQMMANLI